LLHFTRSRLVPSTIRTFPCLGAWVRSDLLTMGDILAFDRRQKWRRDEIEAEEED
ncbi:hypothetical protein EV424DRAFT_1299112, partial [Suillus variegatus]